jgi:hypothetical protein
MTIEIYVQQLIEDLRVAAENVPDTRAGRKFQSERSAMLSHFADVENYIHGEHKKLSKIVGFEKVQFPPPEKLTVRQCSALYEYMEIVLAAFNFYPDFPARLPAHLKYAVMRQHWDEEHVPMSSGESHLEFCNYEPEACPYPAEYCHCRPATGEEWL